MTQSAPDLTRLSREGGTVFLLPLEGVPTLTCSEIVRRVPGRRLVCRGEWNGQAVFAKLFIGHQAGRYAERDARGIHALMAGHLLTPALLHAGKISGQPGQVLIFAAVPDSRNAELVWQTADSSQRGLLAAELVNTVAKHHAAGLLQTDLYLRNFLCASSGIHTLDGDGIRIYRRPVRRWRSLANLALLLSKFDVEEDVFIPELVHAYAKQRGWPLKQCDLHVVQKNVQTIRRRIARQYAERKVLRECTDVHVEHRFGRFLAVTREKMSHALRLVTDGPDAWLDGAGCVRLKNGNTCTVGLVEADGQHIVIKRYNIKNVWHGTNRMLRRTRASISWSNAHRLRMFGIPTPAPLALIEHRYGPLRKESYFLAEYVAGPNIDEVLADPVVTDESKQAIAQQAAGLLHKLYLLGIEHGDMKATNLKIVDGKLMLLDLDAMRQHRFMWWFRRRHARDLRRFLRNWQDNPVMLRMLQNALATAYGSDPVIGMTGVSGQETSEKK